MCAAVWRFAFRTLTSISQQDHPNLREEKARRRTSHLLVKHGVHALIALSFLCLAMVGSSRMNFVCILGFDSADWTCSDVSRSKGKLFLGISTLVEESGVVE